MKNVLFKCLKTLFLILFILININPFIMIADTGPINKEILNVTWPENNVFSCDGIEKEYRPTVNNYIELEYIESTGTQYIDTGLTVKLNRKIEVDFHLLQAPSGAIIFGCRDGTSERRFDCYLGGTKIFFRSTIISAPGPSCEDIQVNVANLLQIHKYSLVYDNTKAYAGVDDAITTVNRTPREFGDNNIFLFTRSSTSSDTANISKGRLYKAKLYDGDTVIRDYIPAMRVSDGKYGLYDKANDKFYPNDATTGDDFKPGPFKNGLSGNKVHDFEVVDSINNLPSKYLDSKFVPIHIKNQETDGPSVGYYIYDSSTDTIWGDSDTTGASAVSFASGGSADYTIYKEVDIKKTDPDDYIAKVELTGLGKIYFNIPSNSTHDWVIKNRIIPSLTAYNGYYDGQEHSVSSYSFKDEDGNNLTGVTINFNTADDGTYPISFDNLPKYTDIGTYRIYYQATKTYYKIATGYVDIVINPTSTPQVSKKTRIKLPNTGIE